MEIKYTTEKGIETGLLRITAARDIPEINVKKGDQGGLIESEDNLSHGDSAWVSGNAQVSGDALVFGDARVSGNALVSGNAQVFGEAQVSGNAWVSGKARVYGEARVFDSARVSGDMELKTGDHNGN